MIDAEDFEVFKARLINRIVEDAVPGYNCGGCGLWFTEDLFVDHLHESDIEHVRKAYYGERPDVVEGETVEQLR